MILAPMINFIGAFFKKGVMNYNGIRFISVIRIGWRSYCDF